MAKLSEPMKKALRYLLFVEKYGSLSDDMPSEFRYYHAKSNTLDALVKRGLITELVRDELGMVAEGGEHKLTLDAHKEISSNPSDYGWREYAYSRDKVYQAEKAEKLAQATPIEEVQSPSVEEAIDALATHLVSSITGLSPEEIKERTANVPSIAIDGYEAVNAQQEEELTTGFFDADFTKAIRELFTEPAKVELPALPEPRCGQVLFDEVQCTRDPGHESEDHGYSPGYGLTELTWNTAWRLAFDSAPPQYREQAKNIIRTNRDNAIRAKERELQDIAEGKTWGANLTERARTCHKIAQEVCEMNGFDPDDVLHAHDGGNHIQVCTLLPPSKSVDRFGLAVAERIGMELKWINGSATVHVDQYGTVGIVIRDHGHL